MKSFIAGLMMMLGLFVAPAQAATCNVKECVTMHDVIPNFASQPTISSVQTGTWTNPSTWNLGRIPANNDIVSIDPNTTVTINDVGAVASIIGVQSSGTLRFQPDVQTGLSVVTLMVMPNGKLEVGTPLNPINAGSSITFTNQPLNFISDPRQFGGGLISVDGNVTFHGLAKTPFQRLSVEPSAGNVNLTFTQPVSGWQVGDKVFLPDSMHFSHTGGAYTNRSETGFIASIAPNGLSVTLAAPLKFNHPGARNGNDLLELLPHVGNLTRNILIQSEAPTGVRGHTLFTGRSTVDIYNTTFKNLGRTTLDPLDNTTFDASGNVLHMGTNHIGRYPLHIHHNYGPYPTSDPYQFTLSGNVVDDDAVTNKFKWGITVHGSHYGLIDRNVVYNAAGWGIGTEDGSESFNLFRGNFVTKVQGKWSLSKTENGHGFWLRGPNNYLRDNVVSNISAQYIGDSIGYNFYFVYLGNVCIPKFKGADMTQCTTMNGNAMPILEFSRNEVYGGGTATGIAYWWIGSQDVIPLPVSESILKDSTVWHTSLYGAYGYPGTNVTFDGFTVRGRKGALTNSNEFGSGIWFSDYMQSNVKVKNADIQNMRTGVYAPFFVKGIFTVEDSYLRNAINVKVSTIGSPGSSPNGNNLPPKTTILRNNLYDQVSGNVGNGFLQQNILMDYNLWFNSANLVKKDAVFVYSYNRVAGDDFQVFYKQQEPNFIVPQSSGNLAGSPVSGLTNAQNWATYNLAIAGEVAIGLGTLPNISGLVKNGTTPPPPPLPSFNPPILVELATISVTNLIHNYDGAPKSALVTTNPPNIPGLIVTYNGLSTLPQIAGVYEVEATLNNASYVAQSVKASLFIAPPIQLGIITTPPTVGYQLYSQPTSATFQVGQTAELKVEISSTTTATYQWQKNGRNIVGATNITYTTPPFTLADNGATYRVLVSNSGGAIASAPFTVSIQ